MRVEAVIIFLCGVGMSLGKYTEAQKKGYLKALKPAFYYAYLSDSYRSAVDRMFPPFVNILVTKVLTDPPYNKNIKFTQTATQGHPVWIPYVFEATESGSPKVCSLTVAEFKEGKDFYYVVPYHNILACQDNVE